MTLNLTQLSSSQNNKETTINDTNAEIEDAFINSVTLSITVSNAYTVSNSEQQRNFFFVLDEDGGSPATADFTVTFPSVSRGLMYIINSTAFTATLETAAQTAPSPTVAAGETILITNGGTNVRTAGSAIADFLSLTDTPSAYSGQSGKAVVVNTGETALEFGTAVSDTAGAVAVHPEHKGAQLKLSSNLTVTTNTLTTVPWASAQYDTEFEPDTGLAQRFWLGADQTFVDGDVTTGTDEVAVTSHGFATGEGPVQLTSSGTLPAGLALATNYWIINVSTSVLKFATSRANAIAGTAVDITAAAGGGTHTIETADKLVVPNGVTKVRLVAQASWEDVGTNSGTRFLNINKNGASFQGGGAEEFNAAESAGTDDKSRQVVASGVVEVTEGDFFQMEVRHRQGVDLDLTVANSTNFFIEVVETTKSTQLPTAYIAVQPAHKGALIGLNGSFNTSGAAENVTWGTTDYDTTYQPNDAGGPQRFWLGVDQTFVDGDVTVGTDEVAVTGHGFTTGEGPLRLTTTGTLPAGLATSTDYWIVAVDADTLAFATSRANALAGTLVNITAAAGGGTHTLSTETHLIVPDGVTKVRLGAGIDTAAGADTSPFQMYIAKNGTSFPGTLMVGMSSDQSGSKGLVGQTAVLEVTGGDFFQCRVDIGGGGTDIDDTDATFYTIEVVETDDVLTYPGVTVERPFIGVQLTLGANVTNVAAAGFPGTALSWTSEEYDTGYKGTEFHSNSTNTSRITIPAGVTRVRLTGNVEWTNQASANTGDYAISIRKNAADFAGMGQHTPGPLSGTNRMRFPINTPVVDVVAGDYFEMYAWKTITTDDDVLDDNATWFAMEVVETEEAAQPPMDLDFFIAGAPTAAQLVYKHVAARRFTLNDELLSSVGHAGTVGTVAVSDFDVLRNGVSIGTISFAVSGSTATFVTSGTGEEVFAIGDVLTVTAPSPANAALADIGISLFAYRS